MTSFTPRGASSFTASEVTPLLATSEAGPIIQPNEETAIQHERRSPRGTVEPADEKPLPKIQIFLLCYARMIEPIAFFGIFPFINKMIKENGNLEEADVGFYSGLIVG